MPESTSNLSANVDVVEMLLKQYQPFIIFAVFTCDVVVISCT